MAGFQSTFTVLQGSYESAGKIQANIVMQSIPIGDRYAECLSSSLQIFLYLCYLGGFAELILIYYFFSWNTYQQ